MISTILCAALVSIQPSPLFDDDICPEGRQACERTCALDAERCCEGCGDPSGGQISLCCTSCIKTGMACSSVCQLVCEPWGVPLLTSGSPGCILELTACHIGCSMEPAAEERRCMNRCNGEYWECEHGGGHA